jgi:hypothetical protein
MTSLRGILVMRSGQTWRESLKRSAPQLVHLARLGRLVANQIRYPVAATMLDWRGTILDGPFKGMRYARSGTGNFSEMLGTYERCLVPIVEQVIEHCPAVVIDVGAAYGYYALGFAWRCPQSRVIAYEMDQTRADLLRKYSRLNDLGTRVETRGECTVAKLNEDLRRAPGAFVLMDVEGAEDVLLRADLANIERSEMLVELHEMFVPGVTERLCERFAATHTWSLIPQTPIERRPRHLNWFIRSFWDRLSLEDRGEEMAWLHLVPRLVAERS